MSMPRFVTGLGSEVSDKPTYYVINLYKKVKPAQICDDIINMSSQTKNG
jgi:hypothetical protein